MTPTSSPGWPDLTAWRGPRLLAVEVKGRRTPVELDQVAWLLLFAQIPTANAWVLRPTEDWRQVARWIADPEVAPVTHGFDPTLLGDEDPAAFLKRRQRERRSRHGSRTAVPFTLSDPPPEEQGTIPWS